MGDRASLHRKNVGKVLYPGFLVDEVVAKVLHVRQVRRLASDLGQQDLDSGDLGVPREDVRVAGKPVT